MPVNQVTDDKEDYVEANNTFGDEKTADFSSQCKTQVQIEEIISSEWMRDEKGTLE